MGLFLAGYTDTNTVQRAGIFISGMSGNMVDATIYTVKGGTWSWPLHLVLRVHLKLLEHLL